MSVELKARSKDGAPNAAPLSLASRLLSLDWSVVESSGLAELEGFLVLGRSSGDGFYATGTGIGAAPCFTSSS